ncbi:hypothetical protein Tco_1321131 [Tanacetum coccineum]
MDTTIPICCIAVLPSSKLCGESDFTITNVSVFVTAMGPFPIVISRDISPNGHDCSLEKPMRGVFESTQRDLIDSFSFKKQCSYITSHELPPSRGIARLGLEKDIQSLSMDKVHRWLRVGVNMDMHKSSRNMQTTRYERLSMVGEKRTVRRELTPYPQKWGKIHPAIFTFPCFNLRRPNTFGIPSPPVSFPVWTNHRVRISQSGSMICKWLIFKSSGGKHDSSCRRSFTSGDVSYLRYRNEMGQGLAHRPVIVGVSRDLRGDSKGCVPRSLFWWEDLDRDGEHGFEYLTFALVSAKASAKGVGLRVADSHTSKHPEDDFMPLETIRRLLVVIGRRSHSGFEGETFEPGDRGDVNDR